MKESLIPVDADKHMVDRLTRTFPTYANDRGERWLRTALSRTSVAFGEIASDETSRQSKERSTPCGRLQNKTASLTAEIG
jgi:hypothetical protein